MVMKQFSPSDDKNVDDDNDGDSDHDHNDDYYSALGLSHISR